MENIVAVALKKYHLFICKFCFLGIFLCASMTPGQVSPCPCAAEEVADCLAPGGHLASLAQLCSSDLKPCQPDVSRQYSLFLLCPACPHAHLLCQNHPYCSAQRLGCLFNLFPFNFLLGSMASYRPSPVFCMRGSNSLHRKFHLSFFFFFFFISSPLPLSPLDQTHLAL